MLYISTWKRGKRGRILRHIRLLASTESHPLFRSHDLLIIHAHSCFTFLRGADFPIIAIVSHNVVRKPILRNTHWKIISKGPSSVFFNKLELLRQLSCTSIHWDVTMHATVPYICTIYWEKQGRWLCTKLRSRKMVVSLHDFSSHFFFLFIFDCNTIAPSITICSVVFRISWFSYTVIMCADESRLLSFVAGIT